MSKARSKVGRGSQELPVGRMVLQMALPFGGDSDTASAVEGDRVAPSIVATPTGVRRPRKRKWYSLYDKVFAVNNLRAAWEKVRANKGAAGCDGQTVGQFEQDAEANLAGLHAELVEKRYRPRPVKQVEIPKAGGGKRRLGIPTVRDRIVQQAVLQVLSPIFEGKFSERSHGFRPGRGPGTALAVVDRAVAFGYAITVDADIRDFFPSVDHELLLTLVNEEVADGTVLKLIRMFLESGIMVDGGEIEASERGTPQGGPLSPLLANIYLHPLDEAMQEKGFGLVRYADDFVIFTHTRERAEEALGQVRLVMERLKLQLHPEKTRVATIDEGFVFLGYRYFRDRKGKVQKAVSEKSELRFRAGIRKRTKRHAGQKRPKAKRLTVTRLRANKRVQAMIAEVNAFLIAWHGYFRGAKTTWRDHFRDFDAFVRRRLRCAITGRYARNRRWQMMLTNKTLSEIGLKSLAQLQLCLDMAQRGHQPSAPPGLG